jgi:hypothetical protein
MLDIIHIVAKAKVANELVPREPIDIYFASILVANYPTNHKT